MPVILCVCYLNNVLSVYEELARIGFNITYWIWKTFMSNFWSVGIISWILFWEISRYFCSHHSIWQYYFWNLEVLLYNKKWLYTEKMFMVLLDSFIISFASFYLILFTCGNSLEIHGTSSLSHFFSYWLHQVSWLWISSLGWWLSNLSLCLGTCHLAPYLYIQLLTYECLLHISKTPYLKLNSCLPSSDLILPKLSTSKQMTV